MYKVALLGDRDSIYGFLPLGLDVYYADTAAKGTEILKDLYNRQHYAVIYITEELAALIKDEIEKYNHKFTPVIILIPGIKGNTGEGMDTVKRYVEKAVGSDILN